MRITNTLVAEDQNVREHLGNVGIDGGKLSVSQRNRVSGYELESSGSV
jgi:hypothetical protein